MTPCQVANESNRFQVPPNRVAKLPKGSGVFSLFNVKSAWVKRCCRSLLPNTYTGSSPRVAVSEKLKWGMRKERAARTPAKATFVSAIAALRSGFFSSATVTACCRVRDEGWASCCAEADTQDSHNVAMLRTTLNKAFNLALPRLEPVSPTRSGLQGFRRLYENSRSSAPWPPPSNTFPWR